MAGSGTGVTLAVIPETVRGTTPGTPQLVEFKTISRNINLKKDLLESQEVSNRRQRVDVRHGFNRVEAEFGVELCMTTYDTLLQYAIGSSGWAAPASGGGIAINSINESQSGQAATLTRATGNFIEDGFRQGDWVTLSGFTNATNNGLFRTTFVSGSTILLQAESGQAPFVSSDSGTLTFKGQKITIGNNLNTLTIERKFSAIDTSGTNLFQIFRGCAVNTFSVNVTPESIVSATFNMIGMSGDVDSLSSIDATGPSGVYTSSPQNSAGSPPFAGIDTTFYIGGSTALASAFTFTVDNQRSLLGILGRRTSQDVYDGVAKVTGTLTLLLGNSTHANNFDNETIYDQFTATFREIGTSDFISVTFYRIKTTTHDVDPPQSGAVTQVMNFEALQQTFTGSSTTFRQVMQIQRSS